MAEEEEVTLLDMWASPYAMKVRIALAEKGVKHGCVEEDWKKKSELLLKMNPVYKQIPVLIHGSRGPICESHVAVQYVDEVWEGEGATLLPSDPFERAQARFWADFIDKKIYNVGKKLICTRKSGEAREAGKREFIKSLKLLETELGEKAYFGGKTFGYVDVTMVPFYSWFLAYKVLGNLKGFNIEAECPRLMEWAKRCLQRESVANSLPRQTQVYDFVLDLKNTLGIR